MVGRDGLAMDLKDGFVRGGRQARAVGYFFECRNGIHRGTPNVA